MSRSARDPRSKKLAAIRNRLLRCEPLEPRLMMTVGPTVARPIELVGSSSVTGTTASLSVLGSDAAGASKLVYDWSITSEPTGASVKFSANATAAAENTTLSFTKAGTYDVSVKIVDPSGLSTTTSLAVNVVPTLTSIKLTTPTGSLVSGALAVSTASQVLDAQALDQFGNALATQPAFKWANSTIASGAAAPTFSGSGASETITFSKVGSYTESVQATVGGVTITDKPSLVVSAKPTYFTVSQTGSATVTGTTAQFTVSQFQDQFHNPISETTKVTWATTSTPSGAATPTFSTSGSTTTVTFKAAGTYKLTATESDNSGNSLADTVTVTVAQTLTSIVVTAGTASISTSATEQFKAQALDQFKNALSTQPSFTWSTSGGAVSAAGLFTAPATAASDTVTAKSGTVSGTATVTVTGASNYLSLQNAWLAQLVQSLDTSGGSITRDDMLQIFDDVEAKGTVTASEFSDLKTIVSDASKLNMPSYVQVLSSDVVNGNTANATYQGAALGNLASGSSATQLTDLVGKWFLGTDLPTLTSSSYTYETASGSLFPQTPSNLDELQGELGDCYLISSLGTIADKDPQAIEDMFINNGDGTYTVRFYTGNYGSTYNSNGSYSDGFVSGSGTADYVTVNLSLPTYGGMLVYADYGQSAKSAANSLWIPLLEKAYAQWDQTGKEGRGGTNSYAGIEGGWMATVDAQVLGHNATDYFMGSDNEQELITALSSGQAVTIATNSADMDGLYGSHAYAVTGYNATSNTFTLYNPWGFDQPGQLTWAQLEAACEGFVAVNASGAAPISGAVTKAGQVGWFAASAEISGSQSADGGPSGIAPSSVSSGESGSSAAASTVETSTAPVQSTTTGGTTTGFQSVSTPAGGTSGASIADLAFGDSSAGNQDVDSQPQPFTADGVNIGIAAFPTVAQADMFYGQLG